VKSVSSLAVLLCLFCASVGAQNTDIFNMTDTWNNAGTTFNAVKMDITDTASAAGSSALWLGFGGTEAFRVDRSGDIQISGSFLDSAGLELIKFTEVAAAINEITISNNSIGLGPTISATGDDADVSLNLAGAGTRSVVIDKSSNAQNDVLKLINSDAGGSAQTRLAFHNASGVANNDGMAIFQTSGNFVGFWNYENGDIAFATNNQQRITIDASTGSLGIGQTNPSAKLDIVASPSVAAFEINLDATPGDAIVIQDSGASDIFRINSTGEISVGGVTPVVGTTLLLPQENSAITPTFAFGNGTYGFYAAATNIIRIATANTARAEFNNGNFSSIKVSSFQINFAAGSSTVPVYTFDGDTDTGMSRSAADTLSLITADVEAINISATQETTIQGTTSISNATEGNTAKLSRRTSHETHTLSLAATSDTTTISVPSNSKLIAVSFNVNTVVTDSAGDDTWNAAWITGSTQTLATNASPTLNTKVDTFHPIYEISTGVCEIQFTPNAGNFTAGVIEVIAYFEDLTSLANL